MSSVHSARQQEKAQKRAERKAEEDAQQARRSEVFAETEGKGYGDLGVIDLSIDEDEDDELSENIQI